MVPERTAFDELASDNVCVGFVVSYAMVREKVVILPTLSVPTKV